MPHRHYSPAKASQREDHSLSFRLCRHCAHNVPNGSFQSCAPVWWAGVRVRSCRSSDPAGGPPSIARLRTNRFSDIGDLAVRSTVNSGAENPGVHHRAFRRPTHTGGGMRGPSGPVTTRGRAADPGRSRPGSGHLAAPSLGHRPCGCSSIMTSVARFTAVAEHRGPTCDRPRESVLPSQRSCTGDGPRVLVECPSRRTER